MLGRASGVLGVGNLATTGLTWSQSTEFPTQPAKPTLGSSSCSSQLGKHARAPSSLSPGCFPGGNRPWSPKRGPRAQRDRGGGEVLWLHWWQPCGWLSGAQGQRQGRAGTGHSGPTCAALEMADLAGVPADLSVASGLISGLLKRINGPCQIVTNENKTQCASRISLASGLSSLRFTCTHKCTHTCVNQVWIEK